jgi:hypothetical protein
MVITTNKGNCAQCRSVIKFVSFLTPLPYMLPHCAQLDSLLIEYTPHWPLWGNLCTSPVGLKKVV